MLAKLSLSELLKNIIVSIIEPGYGDRGVEGIWISFD